MLSQAPSVLNVHTPSSSFAIIHSLTQESLGDLYDKVSRKTHTEHVRLRVGPGWLKYEYNGSIWNLDDESDYTIFSWRQQEQRALLDGGGGPHPLEGVASTSRSTLAPLATAAPQSAAAAKSQLPTLHLHNPDEPLPEPPAYCNASFYLFHPSRAHHPRGAGGLERAPSRASRQSGKKQDAEEDTSIPKLKRDFEKFHSENGVRTVMGSIGPVENVRMLLKAGHRHVYISRKFAVLHGFIPPDSAPGHYGYGGLVSIGEWPITLTPSAASPSGPSQQQQQQHPPPSPPLSARSLPYSRGGGSLLEPPLHNANAAGGSASTFGGGGSGRTLTGQSSIRSSVRSGGGKTTKKQQQRLLANEATAPANGLKAVMVQVYLSEEPHFDVVLGRSFFEKRGIKINSVDPTDVWCLDTGEKIECELVILKDGRGEIVTVT